MHLRYTLSYFIRSDGDLYMLRYTLFNFRGGSGSHQQVYLSLFSIMKMISAELFSYVYNEGHLLFQNISELDLI